ncbi:MAG: hypothetical protein ACI9R3_004799 [Verrucomicrobiales bacterium]|jgi:hypothetical protein
MFRQLPSFSILLVALMFTVMTVSAQTSIPLYITDFSNFPAGDGNLVGNDGWLSTHPDEEVHGTVDDFFGEGNRRATLGFFDPVTTDQIITVYRPINYDPIASDTPVIQFSASVAIVDSSDESTSFDSFYISVFNTTGNLLGSVVFDNTEADFGVWRADGLDFIDTGVSFEHEILYQLKIRIDFAANTWTATLDDAALFTDAPFSNSDAVRNLGDFSAEWEITDVQSPGDNWLLFDDWNVSALKNTTTPDSKNFHIARIVRRPNGNMMLRWPAENGTQYHVEYSDDLIQWKNDLPNSTVTAAQGESEATWADRRPNTGIRYYRVRSQ